MVSATATQTVTISRPINSSPEEVYAAFTDRDLLQNWLCGTAHLRADEGGHLLLQWGQEQTHAFCQYVSLEENKKVSFTWRAKGEDQDSRVTVSIEPNDNNVIMTLTHTDFPDDVEIETYQKEWDTRLDNLVSMLETGADLRITERIIMGILPAAVPEEDAKKIGLEQGAGTLVSGVVSGYSAEKAGLRKGDIVVSLAGYDLTPTQNILHAITLSKSKVGDTVEVGYYRDGQKKSAMLQMLGYPVPELPESFAALGDRLASEFAELETELDTLFDGVTEVEAAKTPAEGEWSANEVMAHLILNERWQQNWLGGFMQTPQIGGYTGNTPARIASITATFPSAKALIAELKRSWQETVAILKNVPAEYGERPSNLWWMNFNLGQTHWHTRGHYEQISEAIAAARA